MPNGHRSSNGSSPLHTSDSENRVVLKVRKKILRAVESSVVGVSVFVVRRFRLLPSASTISSDYILNFVYA